MIKWIFFDIGNVILNDDPAMAVLYKYLHEAINRDCGNITFEELLYHREQSILHNRDGKHYNTVGIKFLGEVKWKKEFKSIRKKLSDNWEKLSPLLPGVTSVIKTLCRHYNLGLIANQPREVVSILKKHNLMQYFKVNGISALIGYQKPDERIFKYALKNANCKPEEAIMIGDRIDNDIVPAKTIGINTIWLKLPLNLKGYNPVFEFEKAYFKSIYRASASQLVPRTENEQPHYIAELHEEILEGVNLINRINK